MVEKTWFIIDFFKESDSKNTYVCTEFPPLHSPKRAREKSQIYIYTSFYLFSPKISLSTHHRERTAVRAGRRSSLFAHHRWWLLFLRPRASGDRFLRILAEKHFYRINNRHAKKSFFFSLLPNLGCLLAKKGWKIRNRSHCAMEESTQFIGQGLTL